MCEYLAPNSHKMAPRTYPYSRNVPLGYSHERPRVATSRFVEPKREGGWTNSVLSGGTSWVSMGAFLDTAEPTSGASSGHATQDPSHLNQDSSLENSVFFGYTYPQNIFKRQMHTQCQQRFLTGEILLCTHNSQLEPYMGTSLIRKRVQAEAAKRKHCREALRLITLAWTAHGVLDMPLARRYCEQVQGAGCRVQGAGCRVQGAGFRVQPTFLAGQKQLLGNKPRFRFRTKRARLKAS
jgi:hypothetical protein